MSILKKSLTVIGVTLAVTSTPTVFLLQVQLTLLGK
nr:Uncharacterised protein [Providencia rettgeri]